MKTLCNLLLSASIALLALGPGFAAAIPEIQHWTTANGARVYFVPAAELPIVDIQIVFNAGSARDGAKPGLALLTNALLDSGTKTLSADAVAERLDAVGAQMGSGANQDMAWLSLRTLSDPQYLTPALDTLAQLLREPAFAPESLERERKRMIAAVQENAQSPEAIARQTFYKALYNEHPYASLPEGNEASLNAIQREDVVAFHRRYYGAANVVVAIIGDLNRASAERLATTLTRQLPAGEAAPALPKTVPLSQAQVIRVQHPSSQSHIYIGEVGISRKDPDYYSLFLGNHALGGNPLVSEIGEEVREKRGLSYGVYSYFMPMQAAGPFLIGLQTRNDQADEAVSVVKSTLKDFVQNGPSPQSLEMARQNIIGGFALRIDSNSKVVQQLANIGFYGLALDYLKTFTDKISSLSSQQVTTALQRHIQPEQMLTVIVGGG